MDRDSNHGKRRQTSDENATDEERKARNRAAARKCRKNKDEQMHNLKMKNQQLEKENKKLAEEKKDLKQQALAYKKSVAMHCEKGCKIPKEMKALWDKELEEHSSSDDSDSERSMLDDVEVSEEMSAPLQPYSDTPRTSQDLQNPFRDNTEHAFEAPIALFSGRPLKPLQETRIRNNSSTKSSSPRPVSPAQLHIGNANPSQLSDLSSFLETTSVPSPLAPISTGSSNDVGMYVDMTAVACSATNNPTSMISDTYCRMGNISQIIPSSRDIIQVQNAPPVVQPRTAMGTHQQLPDNPSMIKMGGADQIAMEYQTERETEEPLLSNEAVTNQNPLLDFATVQPAGYIFTEDLLNNFSENGNKESRHDEMQGRDVSSNNDGSYSCSQFQRGPTIPVHTIAPALLNIGSEMAPSLQQQIKTFSSLPCPTVAGTDVTNNCRHNSWPTNTPEERTQSTTHQCQHNTHNVHPMITSRHVGSWSETASRDREAATGQSFNTTKEKAFKELLQATVLSKEQLFPLKQRQSVRQNPQSGSFTGRKTSAMSLQQRGTHGQGATWTSSTGGINSKTGDTADQTVTHALLDSQSQSVVDLAAQKNTMGPNTLSLHTVANYNQKFDLNQPGLNTSSLFLQRVPQRTSSRTSQIAPNTAKSHSATSISPTTSHSGTSHSGTSISPRTAPSGASISPLTPSNTSSYEILLQSFFQETNGNLGHGHSRFAVATTNNDDVSVPSQHLDAKNTENGFIANLATSNNGVLINTQAGFNTTSWQFQPQITSANNTVHEFSRNPARSNNGVSSSTATRLNTAYQPLIHGPNTTNGHTLDTAANNASYISTLSPGNKTAQPDVPCFNISVSGASTTGRQFSINSRSPLAARVLSQKQVPTAINTHIRNGYSPNTEDFYNDTDTTDQVFFTTSSETSLQPTIQFSGGNFPRPQGPVVTPVDHLPMTDNPNGMLDYFYLESEGIDYFSESPQTNTSVQLRNTADDTSEYTSNNANIQIMGDVNLNTQLNYNSTLESHVTPVLGALNNGGNIVSLTTTNTNLVDNFEGLSNLNITSQPSSGQTLNLNPNLTNFSNIINHNGEV